MAPREKNNPLVLRGGYFFDYDLYFKTIEEAKEAESILFQVENIEKVINTDNASTFIFKGEDKHTKKPPTVQLVKKIVNPPKKILDSFDFVNCAAGYNSKEKAFYLHKELLKFHNQGKLEILNPWMLENITEETKDFVVVQIARFVNYRRLKPTACN